jgi:predicted RNase H-like nuclease (RuvC/YqgF family)
LNVKVETRGKNNYFYVASFQDLRKVFEEKNWINPEVDFYEYEYEEPKEELKNKYSDFEFQGYKNTISKQNKEIEDFKVEIENMKKQIEELKTIKPIIKEEIKNIDYSYYNDQHDDEKDDEEETKLLNSSETPIKKRFNIIVRRYNNLIDINNNDKKQIKNLHFQLLKEKKNKTVIIHGLTNEPKIKQNKQIKTVENKSIENKKTICNDLDLDDVEIEFSTNEKIAEPKRNKKDDTEYSFGK